jgi:hypothetical protein
MKTLDLTKSGVIEHPWTDHPGYTIASAIAEGKLYSVDIPQWASGGHDAYAGSPAEAALMVGGVFKRYGFRDCPDQTKVRLYLPGSRIGATIMRECGIFPTSSADHYGI